MKGDFHPQTSKINSLLMLKLKDSQFPFGVLANQLFYFSSIPRSQWRRLDTNPRPWDDEPSVLPPRCHRYSYSATMEYLRGKYHCTIDLLFDWFGISCLTTNNFCIYLQNRLIQTSQTGGQRYSDTSPFSIPWRYLYQSNHQLISKSSHHFSS